MDSCGKARSLAVCVTTALALFAVGNARGAEVLPSLWPMPAAVSRGPASSSLQLVPRANFTIATMDCSGTNATDLLNKGFARLLDRLWPPSHRRGGLNSVAGATFTDATALTLTGVDVTMQSCDTGLNRNTNESYTLHIPSGGASVGGVRVSLASQTVFGALHGFSTLSQLCAISRNEGTVLMPGVPIVVEDSPRFGHRGLMIDTARHYLSVDTILRVIDGLSYNKLNVLHVHFVDAQSFPLEVAAFPLLSKAGAYSQSMTYDSNAMAQVQQYAYERGVRIVAEIDVPGHAYAWGLGYTNLTARCPTYPFVSNINNIPLDPTNEFTYTVLEAVVGQLAGVLPDSMFHLGGDEVVQSCWKDDPAIAAWMQKRGFAGDYGKLLQYFTNRSQQIVHNAGKHPVQWIEVFDEGLTVAPDTVFQVWKSKADLIAVVSKGFEAILSDSDKWYLNCGFNPSCAYSSFSNVYLNDPRANITDPELANLVIGGEAALWSEFADDTNVDPQLWPRLSAVAERLWSPASVNNATEAMLRAHEQRCRMVIQDGIQATPVGPGYCTPGRY